MAPSCDITGQSGTEKKKKTTWRKAGNVSLRALEGTLLAIHRGGTGVPWLKEVAGALHVVVQQLLEMSGVRNELKKLVQETSEEFITISEWVKNRADGVAQDSTVKQAIERFMEFLQTIVELFQRMRRRSWIRRFIMCSEDKDTMNSLVSSRAWQVSRFQMTTADEIHQVLLMAKEQKATPERNPPVNDHTRARRANSVPRPSPPSASPGSSYGEEAAAHRVHPENRRRSDILPPSMNSTSEGYPISDKGWVAQENVYEANTFDESGWAPPGTQYNFYSSRRCPGFSPPTAACTPPRSRHTLNWYGSAKNVMYGDNMRGGIINMS